MQKGQPLKNITKAMRSHCAWPAIVRAKVPHPRAWLNGGQKADDGSRTRDLELGKLALYQLSYVRSRA